MEGCFWRKGHPAIGERLPSCRSPLKYCFLLFLAFALSVIFAPQTIGIASILRWCPSRNRTERIQSIICTRERGVCSILLVRSRRRKVYEELFSILLARRLALASAPFSKLIKRRNRFWGRKWDCRFENGLDLEWRGNLSVVNTINR